MIICNFGVGGDKSEYKFLIQVPRNLHKPNKKCTTVTAAAVHLPVKLQETYITSTLFLTHQKQHPDNIV